MVKEKIKIRGYMDDWVLIHHDKEYLKRCFAEIRELVEEKLKLRLNPKTQIFPIKNGVDFLGFHAYLTETGKVVLKIRRESAKRMKRKLKAFEEKYRSGELDMKEIEQCLYGWLGHAEYGDTWGLRKKLLDGFILTRGEENET